MAYLMMDEILEKLKMLDYEGQFQSFRPLSHTYFAMASANPNEQFFYFMSLCSWLMGLLGQEWHVPSQMNDPNSSAASLYAKLQEVGAPTNFGGWQKLKQGHGEPCCTILQWLLQQASARTNPRLAAGHARAPPPRVSAQRAAESARERRTSSARSTRQPLHRGARPRRSRLSSSQRCTRTKRSTKRRQ